MSEEAATMKNIPIFDGHNDTLGWLIEKTRGNPVERFFDSKGKGHLDLVRAKKGGLAGGMCAVFVPSPEQKKKPAGTPPEQTTAATSPDGKEVKTIYPTSPPIGYPRALRKTIPQAVNLFDIEECSEGRVKVVRNADELVHCLYTGIFAAVLHFEGAEAIDQHLHALRLFYQAGLRSIGIVWSRPNAFGHGVSFKFNHSPDTGPGLTEAGFRLVKECNRLGIMLDLSHITERGFWDVAETSTAPLVATHSNVHAICPCSRNLTNMQLDTIKQSGGMAGINFCTAFLRPDGRDRQDTPLSDMVRHIDYIAEHFGIDYVGFGSDFNGALVPKRLGDAAGMPKLIRALHRAGYDHEALEKICWKNWVRVLSHTW